MAPIDPTLSLNAIAERLETLEQVFPSNDYSARKAFFSNPTAVNHLQSIFADIGKKSLQRLDFYVGEGSMKGLDILWLRCLVRRFDSAMSNSRMADGFIPWLNETDGVEIWWMLRHGLPSLNRIRGFRSTPLTHRLVSLLEGDRHNALSAMQRLAGSNRFTTFDTKVGALAGSLVLIAIDENCIDKELCSDKHFLQTLMESLSCSDDPHILFLKLAAEWLSSFHSWPSDSRVQRKGKWYPLRFNASCPEESIDLLVEALAT